MTTLREAAQQALAMTRDDIMALANQTAGQYWMDEAHIQRLAALVAAAEREACAKIVDANAQACANNSMLRDVLEGNAAAIRARGNGPFGEFPQRKPLTEEEVKAMWESHRAALPRHLCFARAIERAHGIGGQK